MSSDQKSTIRDELLKPLPPEAVQQRPDGFSYIDQTYVVPEANRIFGYDGWSCEVLVAPHIIDKFARDVDEWEDEVGEGGKKTGKRKKTGRKTTNHVAVVVCTVRVTVGGVHKDGEGACTAEAPIDSYANALETAFKGAVTDGMKRAFILLGERFGIALYDRKNKGRAPRAAKTRSQVGVRRWREEARRTDGGARDRVHGAHPEVQ
jgi:DNA repair and recombination protein RAD52